MMGIGGIGMAGLAYLLQAKQQQVTGCDEGQPRTLDWLRACGIPVAARHSPAHLTGADWAVYSPALQPDQPERRAAEAHLPLFCRGQVLPVLAEQWRTLAVAGTHGKTTTSSMITHILRECGQDPSWCIGGELPPEDAPAGMGRSDWLVVEADESDGTLAHYAPEVSIITNIEFDHMDHFATEDAMRACFRRLAGQTQNRVIGCAEDPEAMRLTRQAAGWLYGFSPDADIRAEALRPDEAGTSFQIRFKQEKAVPVRLPLTGRHMVLNALAAVAAARTCGVLMEQAADCLARFQLPRRRFEPVAEQNGIRILADYAHHPSEIRALIDSVRQAGAARIIAVFQPHRYTRTKALGTAFPSAFEGVDHVVLAPVYAASEVPLEGGTSEDLLRHFVSQKVASVELARDLPDAARRVAAQWKSGDWILLVGAGDIEALGPMLRSALGSSRHMLQ
jgi:UDP-N-acetylmuramate--alanine ligase